MTIRDVMYVILHFRVYNFCLKLELNFFVEVDVFESRAFTWEGCSFQLAE